MKAGYLLILIVCWCMCSMPAVGQVDTGKLVVNHNQLIVRAFTGFKKTGLNFEGPQGMRTVEAPGTVDFGIGLHSEFAGVHLWFNTNRQVEKSISQYYPRHWDVQANFYTLHSAFDFNFQYFQGGWLTADSVRPLRFPHFAHAGINFFHGFNKNYSLASSFVQTSFQRRSQASFVIWAGLAYEYTKFENGRYYRGIKPIIGPGYGGTLVYGRMYLGAVAAVGLAPAFYLNGSESFKFDYAGNLRLGLGYNGNRWIAGASAVSEIHFKDYPGSLYSSILNYGHIKLFVGYRFDVVWNNSRFYQKFIARQIFRHKQ